LKQKSIFIGNFFEKIFENPKKPYFRTLVRIQKQETEGIIPSVSSVNDPVICFLVCYQEYFSFQLPTVQL
jgi:hypothetical protein